MPEESLKYKTKKGLYWNTASNFASRGIQFIFGIILARLLSPDAYGVIGMLTVFIAVVSVFVDCGFSQSLIRKQDRTQTDFSTEFYFNIVVGIICYLILFLSSPLIADFYNMPILSPILKVVGIRVILGSFIVVQASQFAIRLDFKTPAKISVSTQIFTGIIGIVLAYLGWGVWALVFQQLAGSILGAILLWIFAKWRPTWEFSMSSFKYQWNFGSKVLGSSLLSILYDNIQPLIVGKFFSARSLGLFSRANSFAIFPSSNLSGILANVSFPILSKVNNDEQKLSEVYRKLLQMSAYICFPLMVCLAVVASPLVKLLLTEKWYDCIPMLWISCFALIWQPISRINLDLLKVAGRTDVLLKLEIIKKVTGVILLFLSVPYGIIALCFANLLICVFAVIINTVMTSKVLKVSFITQVKDLSPFFIHSLIMGALAYVISSQIQSDLLSLIVGVLICAIYYLLVSILLMKESFNNILYMLNVRKS